MARQGKGAVRAAGSAAGSAMSSAAAAASRLFSRPTRGPPPVAAIQGSMVSVSQYHAFQIFSFYDEAVVRCMPSIFTYEHSNTSAVNTVIQKTVNFPCIPLII